MKVFKRIMIVLIGIIIVLCFAIYLFMHQPSFGKLPEGARLERIERSPNYHNGIFHNQEVTPMFTGKKRSFVSTLFDFFFRNIPNLRPKEPIAAIKTDLKHLERNKNVLIWFGHSSYFIQLDGVRYLVDPVFYSASPLSFMIKPFEGTNIYKPDDMPDIDYLIITHDHWDHLDYKTVTRLRDRIGKIICPLGVGADFEYWKFNPKNIIEMDWNENVHLNETTTIDCLPARHFSGRSLTSNKTLWASFMLESSSQTIYIGGDGGYDNRFVEIGKRFPKINLAILENGQYNTEWCYIHTMPQYLSREAKELHAQRVLTVHHLKFALSKHAWDEPLHNIEQMKKDGVNTLNPKIGEVINL
jgi:L-ascorbate metabolism protein UlaG (beta-lactamase superfamily)